MCIILLKHVSLSAVSPHSSEHKHKLLSWQFAFRPQLDTTPKPFPRLPEYESTRFLEWLFLNRWPKFSSIFSEALYLATILLYTVDLGYPKNPIISVAEWPVDYGSSSVVAFVRNIFSILRLLRFSVYYRMYSYVTWLSWMPTWTNGGKFKIKFILM